MGTRLRRSSNANSISNKIELDDLEMDNSSQISIKYPPKPINSTQNILNSKIFRSQSSKGNYHDQGTLLNQNLLLNSQILKTGSQYTIPVSRLNHLDIND